MPALIFVTIKAMDQVGTLRSELEFAKQISLEAGDIMLEYFRSSKMDAVWKADDTPITVADTKINDLVIKRSQKAFPEYGVLGEEASVHKGREWMWVCDPIDGTMPFMMGLPVSTFSLALTRDGVPQLGVVYEPHLKNLYWAITGEGAFLNDFPIKVSNHGMKNAYIGLEVWAKTDNPREDLIPLYGLREILIDSGAQPVTYSSGVIEGALVAGGQASGLIFGVKKPEDIAALKVIVEEAGGKVTDLEGKDQRYDTWTSGAVVSNGVIHDDLLVAVKNARA